MKLLIQAFFVLCAASIIIFGQSFSQENPRQLAISGSAQIEVPADRVILDFTVKGKGSTLRKAVEEANSIMEEISNKLLNIGLKESDLAISRFDYNKNYMGKIISNDFTSEIRGRIVLENMDILSEVLFYLTESKAEYISNIKYSLRDDRERKNRAREQAIENAKAKAKQMTELTGSTIKRVLLMSEETSIINLSENTSSKSNPNNNINNHFPDETIDDSIISVGSQVQIIYEIE